MTSFVLIILENSVIVLETYFSKALFAQCQSRTLAKGQHQKSLENLVR